MTVAIAILVMLAGGALIAFGAGSSPTSYGEHETAALAIGAGLLLIVIGVAILIVHVTMEAFS